MNTSRGPFVLQFASHEESERFCEELTPLAVTPEKLAARKAVLEGDAELAALHARLVPEYVTEYEFWETRQALEKAAMAAQRVTKGLPSASFVAAARSAAATGGGVNSAEQAVVDFKLDSADIHQVFSEQPAVRRAFLRDVPSKMNEKDFWVRYLDLSLKGNATYFEDLEREEADMARVAKLSTQGKGASAGTAATYDSVAGAAATARARAVDAEINLYQEDGDHLGEGHGIVRGGGSSHAEDPDPKMASARRLLSALNTHSAVVIQGDAPAPREGAIKIAKRLEEKAVAAAGAELAAETVTDRRPADDEQARIAPLEDLKPAVGPAAAAAAAAAAAQALTSTAALVETKPMSAMFASNESVQPKAAASARDASGALASLLSQQINSADSLQFAFAASQGAEKTFTDAVRHKRRRRAAAASSGAAIASIAADATSDAPAVSASELAEMQSQASACHETLRYFWACTRAFQDPLRASTAEKVDALRRRLKRAADAVNVRYDKVEELGRKRPAVASLFSPLLHGPMDASVDEYKKLKL